MDINLKAPGWESFQPLADAVVTDDGDVMADAAPELTCEVRRLSFDESLDLTADMISHDGTVELPHSKSRKYFEKYVRDISGLSINGKVVTAPSEILDLGTGSAPILFFIFSACMQEFFRINILDEATTKNSDSSSDGAS